MIFPPIINIEAIGFADAYEQLVSGCMSNGVEVERFYDKPVKTKAIVSTTSIMNPELEPMLHPSFPTGMMHLALYTKQLERGYDWKGQGFEYHYLDRLVKYPKSRKECGEYYDGSGDYNDFIDQLDVINKRIAARIATGEQCYVSNRDEAITWVPGRDLYVYSDQPCFQRVQVLVYKYPTATEWGLGEYHLMWRSRDGYRAWNSNMAAIYQMMKREIFDPNRIRIGRVVDFINSFHIYYEDWDAAKNFKPQPFNLALRRNLNEPY